MADNDCTQCGRMRKALEQILHRCEHADQTELNWIGFVTQMAKEGLGQPVHTPKFYSGQQPPRNPIR